MFRHLNQQDHQIILKNAKQAWADWYRKGVRPDNIIMQDTLEFWTVLETEKFIRKLIQTTESNGNDRTQ
jgi:hypothetical protein